MKLGMVFEGGANRTVFSCGVMDKFLEENIMPDYYIGVSAGMAYGLSYLSGQKGRNLELMEKYMADKRYMGMRHLLNRKEHAYYNTKFVFEEVPNELLPLDYDALARFPGEIEAAVTNIHTGKAEYMEVPRGKEMKDLLIATCSLPILFQPVKIGRHYYLDGGLAISPKLETVTPYTPGEQPQDQQYIKLNTNESPYLPSPAVVAAVSEHEVEKLRLYSDPACTDLLKTAAVHFGLQPDQIMPGNGSDENLFFALRAFCDETHPLAYADITYGCYSVWCGLMHIPSHIIPLKEDFTLDPADYYGLNETIVIANPNAPPAWPCPAVPSRAS